MTCNMVTIGTKEIKTNALLFYSSTYKYKNLEFFFFKLDYYYPSRKHTIFVSAIMIWE